jgi:hypothetical protein
LAQGSAATNFPNAKIYFSGGTDMSSSYDTDNNIPMWMGRVNTADQASELRVAVGNSTSNAYAKFVVGADVGDSFKPVLTVQMDGKVGISDLQTDPFTPLTALHVSGGKSAGAAYLENHTMAIENTSTAQNGDALALQFTNSVPLTTDHHFVTFFGGLGNSTYIGAIQANTDGKGVRFLSKGADYAEYLEKTNAKDVYELGDVVGVVNGKISKDTTNAQQIMARSYAATVAGNMPDPKHRDRYELIAFFGQVKIKVRGPVSAGDYLIASGLNDGTAVAVPVAAIKTSQMAKIVGTAWESSAEGAVKLIHTAVGFGFSSPTFTKEAEAVADLTSEFSKAKAERRDVMDRVNQRLADQDAEINALIKEMAALKPQ